MSDQQILINLADAICSGHEIEKCCGQVAIDSDDQLIDELVGHYPGDSRLRIWENQQCLVTTKRIARLSDFRKSANRSAQKGWPVYVRSTGGTTVVHRPGVLNVSLAVVSNNSEPRPDESYAEFTKLLVSGLERIGIEATTGSVSGSYCDGRFNICVAGRKLAGTASRIVRREGKAIHLCHGSLTVYGCPRKDSGLVSHFENGLGIDQCLDPTSHVSLIEVLPRF